MRSLFWKIALGTQLLIFVFIAGCMPPTGQATWTLPGQPPAADPDYGSYPHAMNYQYGINNSASGSYLKTTVYLGEEPTDNTTPYYTLYEPVANANGELPASVPVVFYIHGYNDPAGFINQLISHWTRRGFAVVRINACGGGCVGSENILRSLENVYPVFAAAMNYLTTTGPTAGHFPITTDSDGLQYALVGHSMGGIMTNILARHIAEAGVYVAPRALVMWDPEGYSLGQGICNFDAVCIEKYSLENGGLDLIESDTIALILSAEESLDQDDDRIETVQTIYNNLPLAEGINKQAFIVPHYRGDNNQILLSSVHRSPLASPTVNALDYWGYWLMSTAVLDYVFEGSNLEYFYAPNDANNLGLSMGVSLRNGIPQNPTYKFRHPGV